LVPFMLLGAVAGRLPSIKPPPLDGGPLDDGGISEGTDNLHRALSQVLQCMYLV